MLFISIGEEEETLFEEAAVWRERGSGSASQFHGEGRHATRHVHIVMSCNGRGLCSSCTDPISRLGMEFAI
jgi:hypothetical protein